MNCENPEMAEKLLLFIDKSLPQKDYEEVSEHLSGCSRCRKEIEALTDAVGAIEKASVNIKDKWSHPIPEDLVMFSVSPDELSEEKRKRMSAHVSLCRHCQEEMELISASPEAEPSADAKAQMPDAILSAYRNVYSGNNVETAEIGFWERVSRSILVPARAVFLVAAALMIVIFIYGFIANPNTMIGYNNTPQEKVLNEYVEFKTADSGIKDKENFAQYLRESGVYARFENDKLFIKSDSKKTAEEYLEKFKATADSRVAAENAAQRAAQDALQLISGK